jgi:hypothetical protein
MFLLCPAPAFADTDELQPVPAFVVTGHSYVGDSAPSVIRFINARYRSVALTWITFDGREQRYAIIAPGGEVIQPTYVAHRWLVRDAGDDTPLQGFISTRSAARDNGAWQIALIR